MRQFTGWITAALAIWAVSNHAFAMGLRHFGIEDGLMSMSIYDVFQDQREFLWFATDVGVVKFDGNHFTNYSEEDGVCHGQVFGICEDKDGYIWFHSFSRRLSYYEPCLDAFIQPPFVDEMARKTTDIFVEMRFVGDTLVLLSRHGESYDIIDPYSEQYEIRIKQVGGDKSNHRIWQRSDGSFDQSLRGFGGVPERTTLVSWLGRQRVDTFLLRSGQVRNANLIWSERQQSLMFFNNFGVNKIMRNGASWFYPLDITKTRSVLEDSKGNIWIGSYEQGVLLFAHGDLSLPPENILTAYAVSAVCEDRAGGIWIGTLDNGLFYAANPRLQGFETFNSKAITDVRFRQHGDQVYCSVNGDRICQVKPLPNGGYSLIEALHSATGLIDFCVWNDSLITSERYVSRRIYLRNEARWSIHDSILKFRAATANGHYCSISPINDSLLFVFTESDDAKQARYIKWFKRPPRTIFCSASGEIYFLDQKNTFYYLDLDTGDPKHIMHPDIVDREVSDVLSARNGVSVALGKNSRLYLLDRDSLLNVITPFSSSEVSINAIYRDEEPGEGLWLCTNSGLWYMASLQTKPILRCNVNSGLASNSVLSMAFHDGNLMLGTSQGITIGSRDELFSEAPLPEVRIKNVLIEGVSMGISEVIEVDYGFDQIAVDVFATSFRNALHVPYRYRINGRRWSQLSGSSLLLTSLGGGVYDLEIQAANELGHWGKSRLLQINVSPPIWERGWFLIGSTLTVGLLTILIYQYRIHRIRESTMLKEEVFRAQSQALASQLKPHFIYNSMNSMVGYITRQDTRNSLRFLSKLAGLMRAVFENSQLTLITLEQELAALTSYLELEQLRFDFEYEFDMSDEALACEIPPLLIQPIIENAIVHGIPKDGTGKIKLRFLVDGDNLMCEVFNNGRVFDAQKGWGTRPNGSLALIKRRLYMIQELKGTEITVQLGRSEDPSYSTRAQLTFPITA